MRLVFTTCLSFIPSIAWAGLETINEHGIDSFLQGLDGTGVLIGQVEPGRSAKHGHDADVYTVPNTMPSIMPLLLPSAPVPALTLFPKVDLHVE
jgi:hypothetical protein